MSFMSMHTEYGRWLVIEVRGSTDIIPADLVSLPFELKPSEVVTQDGLCDKFSAAYPHTAAHRATTVWRQTVDVLKDYVSEGVGPIRAADDLDSVELREAWGARYSAPGYLDCTDWVLGETEEEAESECRDLYGDEQEEDTPDEGDYVTEDHIRWYSDGKLVLTTADPNDPHSSAHDAYAQVKAHMESEGFHPNAWFISDHGNAHLIDL